jgi:hypothetical protein
MWQTLPIVLNKELAGEMGGRGFEPLTSAMSTQRSNQLS